jgi:SPRY domain
MTTWNPADIGANLGLTNGNLTGSETGGGSSWRSCRSTTSKSSGKWAFKVHVTTLVGNQIMLGVATSSLSLANYSGSDSHSIGLDGGTTQVYQNGTGPSGVADAFASGGDVGVYLDFTNSKVWFWDSVHSRYNGAAIGSQDPGSNIGGFNVSSFTASSVFASFTMFGSSGQDSITADFTGVGIPLPSGFSTWDTAPPPSTVIRKPLRSYLRR